MAKNRTLIAAAVVLVVALLAGIGVAVWRFVGNGDAGGSASVASSTVGTPADLLADIPTSTPEPSWTVELDDLIGVPNLKQGIVPGNVDNRAFSFVYPADESAGRTRAWVYSFDYQTGEVLFPPVELTGSPDECYVNGPEMVLCLGKQDSVSPDSPPAAWVIDSHTGELTFNGPTDIRNELVGGTKVYRIGLHPVVSVSGAGWYGIGSRGERTWFVPGSGLSTADVPWSDDVAPQRLVTAKGTDDRFIVFSAADGALIADQIAGQPWLYSGGYAVPSRTKEDPAGAITFFDESGKELSRFPIGAQFVAASMATRGELLVVDIREPSSPEGRWLVFDNTGEKIVEIPAPADPGKQRVVIAGDKMYVSDTVGIENTADENPWKQIDLSTGSILRTCNDLNMRGYVASDGDTILSGKFEANRDLAESAVSTETCDTLWTIDATDSGIVKVGDALVWYSDTEYRGLK